MDCLIDEYLAHVVLMHVYFEKNSERHIEMTID